MKNKIFVWYIVNIIFVFSTVILFIENYKNAGFLFMDRAVFSNIIVILTALLVHIIKAVRLFFALYGNGLNIKEYLCTYCKVTPVSMILPFKLGEFFRIFCYGKQIGSFLRGTVIVVLDRFMDTLALISVMAAVKFLFGGKLTTITFILLLFLFGVMFVYLIFPNFYSFWKKYLLQEKASKHKLWGLSVLERLQFVYKEAESVLKGRGIILFFLSLLAWIVECIPILLFNTFNIESGSDLFISEYLMSAVTGKNTLELNQFIFVSVTGLIAVYIILIMILVFERKGLRK